MKRSIDNLARLAGKVEDSIGRTGLDLHGLRVLTEASTGHYAATAPLAAAAGADRVLAVARPSRYGSAEDAFRATREVAKQLGVEPRVEVASALPGQGLGDIDVVTNSGHLRPIGRPLLSRLKSTAVVSLMYEPWELRPTDVDLACCRELGIAFAGTNEQDPRLDLFRFLGPLALWQLMGAGIEVLDCRVLLLCDNDFRPHLLDALDRNGAQVVEPTLLGTCRLSSRELAHLDAVLVATTPAPGHPAVGSAEATLSAEALAQSAPGCIVCQFWGDVDRVALREQGVTCHPEDDPGPGHMGVLFSDLGMTPVVRLQAAGLKVGQVLAEARRAGKSPREAIRAAEASGFGRGLSAGADLPSSIGEGR
jgi:hypothetical protein